MDAVHALDQSPDRPARRPATITQSGFQDPDAGRPLCCRQCGHGVTGEGYRTERLGRHEHGFMNPHGFSFRVGCFAAAPGCAGAGPATDEHTWFPGYRWRLALCGGCAEHLGWLYEDGAGDAFWGLILARLQPCPEVHG